MAVADAVASLSNAANNATVEAQPGSGVEWLIHTLLIQDAKSAEVYVTNDSGSNYYLLRTIAGGDVHALTFRCTNSHFIRVKNVSGGSAMIGYQGVVTK